MMSNLEITYFSVKTLVIFGYSKYGMVKKRDNNFSQGQNTPMEENLIMIESQCLPLGVGGIQAPKN